MEREERQKREPSTSRLLQKELVETFKTSCFSNALFPSSILVCRLSHSLSISIYCH